MAKAGLTESIRDNLRERRDTDTHKETDAVDRKLIQNFKAVKDTKDVGLVLDAFATILEDTEKNGLHPDNPEIAKSTANALRELAGARETLPTVFSPDSYDCVARAHITPKKTDKQERPKDQVRDFLASQISRVKNELKVTSSDAKVGLLNAQVSCLRTAEREYIKLQDKAMGREPSKEKKRDKGIER